MGVVEVPGLGKKIRSEYSVRTLAENCDKLRHVLGGRVV
jgi:hypothetical protein